MPRLLILTQYFPPEMGAPQARLSGLGEQLLSMGWDVEVLTALPNYPTGSIFSGYDPRAPIREKVGRIETIRLPLRPAKEGFLRRLYCYFSFVRSCNKHAMKLCKRPDIIFVESPPLFIGLAARRLKRKWGVPFVFNVSDLWPESALRMDVIGDGLLFKMAERFELSMYKDAVAVTGQSDEIIKSIQTRYPGIKTSAISNGVDPGQFGPGKADEEGRTLLQKEGGQTIFLYAGLFGLAQGLDQIVDIAIKLRNIKEIKFVLVGDGPVRSDLEARVQREGLMNVLILPPQKREKIPALLAAADVALITLGLHLPGAVPSKIYEAMASAIPILLVAEGEPARRVAEVEAGISVDVGNLDALEKAVLRLHQDGALRERMGKSGRFAAETLYNRKNIAIKLDNFLKEVIAHA